MLLSLASMKIFIVKNKKKFSFETVIYIYIYISRRHILTLVYHLCYAFVSWSMFMKARCDVKYFL